VLSYLLFIRLSNTAAPVAYLPSILSASLKFALLVLFINLLDHLSFYSTRFMLFYFAGVITSFSLYRL
ncbi:MAG TPA: hypothetical protein VFH25_03955, partial [Nitrososphaeraceae archaeon]|nr:hypothetical protein [Nitrososphaeraceae archaeon]